MENVLYSIAAAVIGLGLLIVFHEFGHLLGLTDLYDESGEFLGRADLYYRPAHLVIEFDGGNHRDRLVSDNRRQNSLQQAGYRVLRFTSPDVYGRPNDVVGLVRATINRHRAFRTLRADQRTILRCER